MTYTILKQLKALLLAVILVCAVFPILTDAYVSVDGYYRKDGTYVRPHVRSEPNGLKYDNYSYTGGELYNKTYGTRGADWDTPAWITDPDYYEGKALYESGGYGSSYNIDTYSTNYSYSTFLRKGMTSDRILNLQFLLATDGSIYPEGIVSGYYGPLTEQAVKRFQTRHGIVLYGTPDTTGYGQIGPVTEKKINEVYSLANRLKGYSDAVAFEVPQKYNYSTEPTVDELQVAIDSLIAQIEALNKALE